MHILAHRGLWRHPEEQNTLAAFARAFDLGFGIETDVRDSERRLVISHNPPCGPEPSLEETLSLLANRPLFMAINIKADGLAGQINAMCQQYSAPRWFVFDMSVPDMRQHLRMGNPVYGRMSEVEPTPPWQTHLSGIWLDGFDSQWYDAPLIERLLATQLPLCVVSAELHARNRDSQWTMLYQFSGRDNLLLCTDAPVEARAYFVLEDA